MASKLWLKAIFLFLVVQQSEQEEINCNHKNNCDISASSVGKITCEHVFGSNPPCKCEEGTPCPDVSALDYSTFDYEKCSTFCEADPECAFWKYTDSVAERAKKCFLMAKEECKEDENGRMCPKYHENEEHTPECISDKTASGDFTCADGTDNSPPDGQTCPGPIEPTDNQDEKLYVQKWKCYNPDPETDFEVNMYDADATMPLGGWCSLIVDDGGSCKNPKEFRFNCELEGQKGTWMKASDIEQDDANDVKEGDRLKDVTCTALPLQFTTAKLASQTGRNIVCSKGGIQEEPADNFFVPAENYCHMFCDGYDVLTFYTDWNTEGTRAADDKRGWFYKVSSSSEDPVSFNDADYLNCWGKHF